MQRIYELMKEKALKLLNDGTCDRVLGWKKGDMLYDQTPSVFYSEEELEDFVYDDFSCANLAKYLINESKKEGKILVFLKPCDTYNFNQLLLEHRVNRDNVHIVGVSCKGKFDINKIRDLNLLNKGTLDVNKIENREEILLEKCLSCKSRKHVVADELITIEEDDYKPAKDRFEQVRELENMTEEERFSFWRKELSKCIRCNACRNVCPACSCEKCVFDNERVPVFSKANSDSFEESMFHIIRAYHVAGRCTDCGECSRVCPQNIPLHLLNRKFIKDINEFFGEFQAGTDSITPGPLTSFSQEDRDPSEIFGKGGDK